MASALHVHRSPRRPISRDLRRAGAPEAAAGQDLSVRRLSSPPPAISFTPRAAAAPLGHAASPSGSGVERWKSGHGAILFFVFAGFQSWS